MLKFLDSRIIKIIACVTMVIDHVGHLFFPEAMWLRAIGRISMPLFCFLIAFGSVKTKNNLRYFLHLFMCATVFQFVFNFVSTGSLFIFEYMNVFFILSMGSLAIMCIKKSKNILLKILFPILILGLVMIIEQYVFIDYGAAGFLLMVCFYFALNFSITVFKISAAFSLAAFNLILFYQFPWAIQWFAMLALIPLVLFSDKHIKISKFEKYAFYAFYPLHMIILFLVAMLMGLQIGM